MSRTWKTDPYWVQLKRNARDKEVKMLLEDNKGFEVVREVEVPPYESVESFPTISTIKHNGVIVGYHEFSDYENLSPEHIARNIFDSLSDDYGKMIATGNMEYAGRVLNKGDRLWDKSVAPAPVSFLRISQLIHQEYHRLYESADSYQFGVFYWSKQINFATEEGFFVIVNYDKVSDDHYELSVTTYYCSLLDKFMPGKLSIYYEDEDLLNEHNFFKPMPKDPKKYVCDCYYCDLGDFVERKNGKRGQVRAHNKELIKEFNSNGDLLEF